MPGPGEYRPDPSQGITRIEDLPKPKIRCQSRNYRRRPCPRCGQSAYRDRRVRRTLHDLGNPLTGRPRELIVIYSQHCCTRCRKYFNADMTDLAAPGSHSTKRVVDTAVRLVIEDGLPYRAASWSLWRDHRVFVPYATIQNWVEDGGEKAQRRIPTDYLDWALSDFSGYIAADELYDGPFCVLSIVDNRTFKRLSYHVLDRDPTQVDIEAFFRRFRQALEARGLTVQGITTDGSTLYPEPIAAVFGAVPHQVCQFHILHEVNKAILSAVAQERKRLAAGAPKLPRGRPSSKAAKRAARRKKRIKQKVGELFAHRYLFVQRRLSPSERATLQRICRGWPQLRSLRGLMEEVYRLFDRRCRMATALAKLEKLRARLRRFGRLRKVLKKLLAPGLEKALVFLDERLLGATSNAVERGNRRYRKMQKTVYRVRTQRAIEGRLALDLLREQHAQGRAQTRLSSLCSFRTLYFTPESGPATEGFSCRGAVMNDEGNAARKIRKLRASRDLWKQRSAEKQQEIRQLRVTVRDLSSSRENWKTRVKELEQQLQAAHEAHAAVGPGSWIFFGGLMDNQAMPRTRRTPITLSSD